MPVTQDILCSVILLWMVGTHAVDLSLIGKHQQWKQGGGGWFVTAYLNENHVEEIRECAHDIYKFAMTSLDQISIYSHGYFQNPVVSMASDKVYTASSG